MYFVDNSNTLRGERAMGHPVTLIYGDGIGPEVSEATRLVIDATGVSLDWQVVDAGLTTFEKTGTPLPEQVLATIRETKTALKGPIATPRGQGLRSVNAEIRKQLNLYASVRPVKSMAGVRSLFSNLDLVVVRENTEDFYAGIEFERTTMEAAEVREFLTRLSGVKIREDTAIGVKSISVLGSRQIVDFAFRHATACGRRKVTVVHQAHMMKSTDGLFLDIAREVAKEYPHIAFEDRAVDTVCMQLVQNSEPYDVLLTSNLYGDILSDLCAGMTGGLGVTPGAHVGDEYAVFAAMHGTVPSLAGLNKANPTALILSGVLMLQHLGEVDAAARIQAAVEKVIAAQKAVTADLEPEGVTPVGTKEMAEAIAAEV
jgi:isocitrate dehydrogenase (NAD+)